HAVLLFTLGLAAAGAFSGAVIADVTTSSSTTTGTTTTAPATTVTTTTTTTTTATGPATIPAGVRVAGVRVGGLRAGEAVAAVRTAFARPPAVVVDRSRLELDPARFASAYIETAVARAPIASPGTYLYETGKLWRTFGVATGQAIYPTPRGEWHIVVKYRNPWWYPPTGSSWARGLQPVPPGPSNPLGTRWMGLDASGVGIHGTNNPSSIGYSASHGCVRMQVPDAEWLFDHVDIGTTVFVV